MKVRSQSKKINKAWLNDHVNDPYVKLALKEGYRSRAAYKLKEIDETLGLFKPGMAVVDLGSTPGAWPLPRGNGHRHCPAMGFPGLDRRQHASAAGRGGESGDAAG